jgi:ankyrin repeat protein
MSRGLLYALDVSEALQALYAGDDGRARSLLRPDSDLTIFEAAAFGRIDRLRSLLASDPGRMNEISADGFTALHLAVFGKQEEAVRVLIAHGADLDLVSNASFAQVTPLGTAAFVRSLPLAEILLEAGADPSAGEETPASTAHENGDKELVALIRAYGG